MKILCRDRMISLCCNNVVFKTCFVLPINAKKSSCKIDSNMSPFLHSKRMDTWMIFGEDRKPLLETASKPCSRPASFPIHEHKLLYILQSWTLLNSGEKQFERTNVYQIPEQEAIYTSLSVCVKWLTEIFRKESWQRSFFSCHILGFGVEYVNADETRTPEDTPSSHERISPHHSGEFSRGHVQVDHRSNK